MATVTFEPVNATQVTIRPRIYKVDIGKVGFQGPPGPPGDITADQTVVWTVPQAWCTDAWGYGDLDGTASENTTSLQAALDAVDDWQELLIRTPAGQDIHINDTLHLGECSGKTIRVLGTPNGYGSPSAGGRIVMDTDAIPIFEVGPVTFARSLTIEMSLAYADPQTDPNAVGFLITADDAGVGGQPHNWQIHIDVENSYDALKFEPGAGSAPNFWGNDIQIRALDTYHTAVDIVSTGSPTNKFDIFASNQQSGIVPTGPAVNLYNLESEFSRLNIEDWADTAVYLFGGSANIGNLHIERHVLTGVDNSRICVSDEQLTTVRNAQILMHQTTPGTSDGYAVCFYENEGGGLKSGWDLNTLITNFPVALAGRVALIDGADLSKTNVGSGWKDLGTREVELCIPSSDGGHHDTTKYYGWNSLWTEPGATAPWATVGGYQVPRYRRVGNRVQLEGALVQNTSGGTSIDPVYTLPAHMRPLENQLLWSYGSAFIVTPAGVVRPDSGTPVAASGYIGLTGTFSVV